MDLRAFVPLSLAAMTIAAAPVTADPATGGSAAVSAEGIPAPRPDGPIPLFHILELDPFEVSAPDPHDKGSTYTDGSEGGIAPAGPNGYERMKLDFARAAIEASRAAGTLFVLPPEMERTAPADAEAEKLARMKATPPAELPPDPASGVGVIPIAPQEGDR